MSTVFHIGLSKAASTALQRYLFPRLDSCAYVGHKTHELVEPLLWSLLFSADETFFPATLRQFLRDVQGDNGAVVFSQESISWHHHEGRTARRLHLVDEQAMVILVVRSQRTMLRSIYHQYLQRGGCQTLRGWLDSSDFDPSQLRYDQILVPYLELFGPERVVVLLFEDLQERPGEFVGRLCRTTGLALEASRPVELGTANRSLSRPSLWALRTLNHVYRRLGWGSYTNMFPNLWPRGRHSARPFQATVQRRLARLDSRVDISRLRQSGRRDRDAIERVAASCAASNARLEDLTGLSLRRYGYPLPG